MRVVIIWVFFLTYAGVGHETFSYGKLGGFVMIVLGVLFFNKILNFDFCLGKSNDESIELAAEQPGQDDELSEQKSINNSDLSGKPTTKDYNDSAFQFGSNETTAGSSSFRSDPSPNKLSIN